jgi:predicted permease
MHTLWQDLRYASRLLTKKPGFTVVAVITLALGIGANSAIFSLVNALLLRPLPYRDSGRLVIIWTHSPGANVVQDWPSPGQYSAIESQNTVFEEMAMANGSNVNLTGRGAPERLGALRVTSAMFSLLDAKAALGRVFLPEEDSPGGPATVVLSNGLWQRDFGADPDAIGQPLTLNGRSYTIVGVMPSSFSLNYEVIPSVGAVDQVDVLLPLPMDAKARSNQGDENYNVIARLKPGATVAQAQAELDAAVRTLEQQFPDDYPAGRTFSMSVKPLLEQVVGDIRPALMVLLGAVGCVLLIACANVANLLLARAAAREKEVAIRTAIGASRRRLMRQLLTESLLLAFLGGGIGLVIALWSLAALRWLNPGNIPRLKDVSIDVPVLAFTFGVVMLTGILFGLVPALRSSQVNLNETLKEGGRSSSGNSHHRLGSVLVVAEVALSLILLIGAGLLIRSFARVQAVAPGFAPERLVSTRVAVAGTAYADSSRRSDFYKQVLASTRRLPGVESVGLGSVLPLSGGIGWGGITIEGH